jgi:hypothetical protein
LSHQDPIWPAICTAGDSHPVSPPHEVAHHLLGRKLEAQQHGHQSDTLDIRFQGCVILQSPPFNLLSISRTIYCIYLATPHRCPKGIQILQAPFAACMDTHIISLNADRWQKTSSRCELPSCIHSSLTRRDRVLHRLVSPCNLLTDSGAHICILR